MTGHLSLLAVIVGLACKSWLISFWITALQIVTVSTPRRPSFEQYLSYQQYYMDIVGGEVKFQAACLGV